MELRLAESSPSCCSAPRLWAIGWREREGSVPSRRLTAPRAPTVPRRHISLRRPDCRESSVSVSRDSQSLCHPADRLPVRAHHRRPLAVPCPSPLSLDSRSLRPFALSGPLHFFFFNFPTLYLITIKHFNRRTRPSLSLFLHRTNTRARAHLSPLSLAHLRGRNSVTLIINCNKNGI